MSETQQTGINDPKHKQTAPLRGEASARKGEMVNEPSELPKRNNSPQTEGTSQKWAFQDFSKWEDKYFKTLKKIIEGTGKLNKAIIQITHALAKSIGRYLLAAVVLTGFAKKETANSEAEQGTEPPKATLSVGTLGMTLMKAKINGDKKTDFEANMILAKTAKEMVDKINPELKTDGFFEEKPMENGAYSGLSKKLDEATQTADKAAKSAVKSAIPFGRGGNGR